MLLLRHQASTTTACQRSNAFLENNFSKKCTCSPTHASLEESDFALRMREWISALACSLGPVQIVLDASPVAPSQFSNAPAVLLPPGGIVSTFDARASEPTSLDPWRDCLWAGPLYHAMASKSQDEISPSASSSYCPSRCEPVPCLRLCALISSNVVRRRLFVFILHELRGALNPSQLLPSLRTCERLSFVPATRQMSLSGIHTCLTHLFDTTHGVG